MNARLTTQSGRLAKWVVLRRCLLALSAALLAILCVASFLGVNWIVLLCLILAWGTLSVAIPMPHLPGLLRAMTRALPNASGRVERLLTAMEYDVTHGGDASK